MYSDQLLFNQMENCNMCHSQNASDGIPNGFRGIAHTFLVCSILFLPLTTAAQNIIYVDSSAAGGGNGTTWDSAYQGLQEALHAVRNSSAEIDQIWVAKGTYFPTVTDNRNIAFELIDGVSLYGGFRGNEASLGQRTGHNSTILSGDISDFHLYDSKCIVRADSVTSIVDGFIVSDGGKGITAVASDLVLDNLQILRNGGGLEMDSSFAIIRNVEFRSNRALNGGGAYIVDSEATFRNVVFRSNIAGSAGRGGALHAKNSEVGIVSSIIVGNIARGETALVYGGGIYAEDSRLDVISSLLAKNSVERCDGNPRLGGAIHYRGPDTMATSNIVNSLFFANAARACHDMMDGAAIDSRSTSLHATNSLFYNNELDNGIYPATGGIISGSLTIANSIVWKNDGTSIVGDVENVHISHTTVEEEYPGDNMISIEPEFIEPPSPGPDSSWGTDDDEYGRLQKGSSLNDFGDRQFLPSDTYDLDEDGDTSEKVPLDFAGNARVQNGAIDLGPFEYATSTGTESRQITHSMKLRVYPNPVATNATVEVVAPRPQTCTITLLDVPGRKVKTWRRSKLHAGINEIMLKTKHISSGIYFLRVSGVDDVVSTSIAIR